MKMGFIFGGGKKAIKDTPEEANRTPVSASSTLEKAVNGNSSSGESKPKTIGELKASGYSPLPIRERNEA